jgi:hypothetical protein
MNERIEKLALQAKIQFTYDPTEKPIRAFAECWEDELEKFAELIVRECMTNLYIKGHDDAVIQLREEFGVEL